MYVRQVSEQGQTLSLVLKKDLCGFCKRAGTFLQVLKGDNDFMDDLTLFREGPNLPERVPGRVFFSVQKSPRPVNFFF